MLITSVGTIGKNNMIITQSIINNCEVKNNDLVNNNFVKLIAQPFCTRIKLTKFGI